MRYFWASICSPSYWRYALLSSIAFERLLAIVGGIYLLIDMLDFFGVITRDKYGMWGLLAIVGVSVFLTLFSHRPTTRVKYKLPNRDVTYEIIVGDLLSAADNIVISTSTTFDTNIASGLISQNSLQGQVATRFFQGNTDEIDRQIDEQLKGVFFTERAEAVGKKKEFPIGTVARIVAGEKNFYFLAMSRLNEHGNAMSTGRMIDQALEGLWEAIANKGEFGEIAMPVIGTGRGRVGLRKQKVIEKITQSFADASQQKTFSPKLKVIISPIDADADHISLFQIRDYLKKSLAT